MIAGCILFIKAIVQEVIDNQEMSSAPIFNYL